MARAVKAFDRQDLKGRAPATSSGDDERKKGLRPTPTASICRTMDDHRRDQRWWPAIDQAA
ncbi:hypothetical protein CSC94_03305 [Zhengella mangrovi]|uniref:Uncharacterized protein n=1 Tax=Zhengella mangrovi TaxID=1982044 RepID=A0A2G1QU56_9HYPH|nr:hypothetical protein CSC94_03305 [Zhengella mangrovi]